MSDYDDFYDDDEDDDFLEDEDGLDGFGYMDDDGEWVDGDEDEEDEYSSHGWSLVDSDDDDEEPQYQDEPDEVFDVDF